VCSSDLSERGQRDEDENESNGKGGRHRGSAWSHVCLASKKLNRNQSWGLAITTSCGFPTTNSGRQQTETAGVQGVPNLSAALARAGGACTARFRGSAAATT